MSFGEAAEQQITEQKFKQKTVSNVLNIFQTSGSAGANPQRLAQILTAFDLAMRILGWQDKPLANLTNFLTQYQASIDTKYHKDFKDVLVAEEIERRREQRKGISILQQ